MMAHKLLANPIVSFDVQPRFFGAAQSLMLGNVDRSRYDESLMQSMPVFDDNQSNWCIRTQKFLAGNDTLAVTDDMCLEFGTTSAQRYFSNAYGEVRKDTGGLAMKLPDAVLDGYWAHAQNASNSSGQWQFPCESLLQMPNFTIVFDSSGDPAPAVIPASQLSDKFEENQSEDIQFLALRFVSNSKYLIRQ